jgi:hypothetical protein
MRSARSTNDDPRDYHRDPPSASPSSTATPTPTAASNAIHVVLEQETGQDATIDVGDASGTLVSAESAAKEVLDAPASFGRAYFG